ncbi:MAG: DUF799 family lipoprotein [Deltaproteobacteria bacterium]|nr:DUF799 family lipoprotein [Deltaproteobacteria bacterium]
MIWNKSQKPALECLYRGSETRCKKQDVRKKTYLSFYCLLLTAYCALFFGGCSGAIKYSLAPDYNAKIPNIVAVLPVEGYKENKDAQYLFRIMAHDKLVQMGYSPISLEAVDAKLLGSGMRMDELSRKTPKELAAICGADSLLYITITEWDDTMFLSYASQTIEAKFELYDGAGGGRLWEAEFHAEDSDLNLETDVIKLGVIKVYEPVIQRIVDAVFSTMPDNKMIAGRSPKKTYYDWLP